MKAYRKEIREIPNRDIGRSEGDDVISNLLLYLAIIVLVILKTIGSILIDRVFKTDAKIVKYVLSIIFVVVVLILLIGFWLPAVAT